MNENMDYDNSLNEDYPIFLGLSILEIKKIAEDIFAEEIVWEDDCYLDEDGKYIENLSLSGELKNVIFHLTTDNYGSECIDIKIVNDKWTAIFKSDEMKSSSEQLKDVFSDISLRKIGFRHSLYRDNGDFNI